jgi:hypothetical protein
MEEAPPRLPPRPRRGRCRGDRLEPAGAAGSLAVILYDKFWLTTSKLEAIVADCKSPSISCGVITFGIEESMVEIPII